MSPNALSEGQDLARRLPQHAFESFDSESRYVQKVSIVRASDTYHGGEQEDAHSCAGQDLPDRRSHFETLRSLAEQSAAGHRHGVPIQAAGHRHGVLIQATRP